MDTTPEKNNKGCGIAALIGMLVACLLLIGGGVFVGVVIGELVIAFLCGGIGVMGFVGFGILGIVVIRQSRQGITAEDARRWESGTLTDKRIKKDIGAHRKTTIISSFAMTGVLIFFAVLALCSDDTFLPLALILAVAPFVTLIWGITELVKAKTNQGYRIVLDRVTGSEVKTTFDVVDAMTTHLPTRTPVLYLEKHGEYKINAMHIHAQYPAEALAACIEPGEEVYVVYSAKNNELLHIYRKKFWTWQDNG